MKKHPLVSIVIPVYNGSNYLRESIDSALAQTYDNVEIIVVNDGSKDDGATEAVALSYGDKIRYFAKENGGVSTALNYGISVMKGEWFSWLSHDDLYYPDKIKAQIDYLETRCLNEEKCVLYCDSELIDCDGKVVYKFKKKKKVKEYNNTEIMVRNLHHNRLGGCTFLVPKAAFDEIGTFNVSNRTMSDFDMWYRLLLNDYKFNLVNEVLVKTRIHKKQVTYTMSGLGAAEFAQFYTWVIEEIAKRPQFAKKQILYKMGQYSLERGLQESAEVAFSYAQKTENSEFIFILRKHIYILFAQGYKLAKNTAKKVFALINVK